MDVIYWELEELHAGVQVNPLTAYGLLDAVGAVPEGAWLAQSAAGSVLGRQILALCQHRGIQSVNLVRRAAQKEELLSLGCAQGCSTMAHACP